MSFTGSHTVDLSGRLKKTKTASRRSTAGQTSGGAVMAAAVAQADSAGEGARPSSGMGGGGGGRCCAAPGAANRSTVTLDGRHERRRGERRARVTRLASACRELGEREERLEMGYGCRGEWRSFEARRSPRWPTRGHGRRETATGGVSSSKQRRCSNGISVNISRFQKSSS